MTAPAQDLVLVTGISGSGKSVALHALEDAGYFCVDNLPPELLREFLRLEHERFDRRVAIAVDVRSAGSLPHLLPLLEELKGEGVAITALFLDASTDALVRRSPRRGARTRCPTRRSPPPRCRTGAARICATRGGALWSTRSSSSANCCPSCAKSRP